MKKPTSILRVIAGIFILVLVTVLLFHAWLPGVLSSKIENEIRTGLNPGSIDLYKVEAGITSFSTLFHTTSISEIRVIPKEIALRKKNARLLPNLIFETEAYNLNISSWTLISLAMGWKNVKVNQFFTDSLFAIIYINELGTKKSDSARSMNMKYLDLKNLSTKKLSIEKRTIADSARLVLQTGRVKVKGAISLKSVEQNLLSFQVLDASIHSSHGLYRFHIDSIFFDSNKKTANLHELRVIPRHTRQEFHKQVQFQTDRLDARLDHIKISGLQFYKAIRDSSIVLAQVEINGGKLEVFRDRKPPFNEKQRPLTPVRLIQKSPFGLFAGKILLNGIEIVYADLPEDSDSAGEVPFKQLSATINNITNLKDSLASDSIMSIRAEASVFGKAMLKAEFKYNLIHPGGIYEATGDLAEFSFVDINPALYPITGIKINDGMHQNTSFYFYGNDVRTVGELRMRYSGLEIEVIPDGRKVYKDLARFAGKMALYHQNNPSGKGELRVGKIEFDRDISRFVFNYWWKSFLSGTKDTMLQGHFNL